MAVTVTPAAAVKPPTGEIGAERWQSGLLGWAHFIDDSETTPDLQWPQSIPTYHRMRTDSQVEALHLGTTMAVREYRWSIDPNGAPAALVEQAAADLGLSIRGHEDENVKRSASRFDFDAFLADALLAPLYGHFHFEIVGDTSADLSEWHVHKLAPRHPRTIMEFQTLDTGELLAIRQNIPGAQRLRDVLPPPIPAVRLLPFVWRSEAGNHVGRSMLRSLYREWLVKDRTVRVAAINIERAGGMPVVEGPPGASDVQLRDLAMLARQFKVAEGGGGAIPYNSKLHLVGGNTPDAISLLKYCDEAMARVWSLMLIQLGQTQTGSRALGGQFHDYASRTQRALAKWICAVVNDLLDRYTEWNRGSSAAYAPRLTFEQTKPDDMSTDELVALIDAGALTVDPELEDWLRDEHGLPDKPRDANGDPIVNTPASELPAGNSPTSQQQLPAPQLHVPGMPAGVNARGLPMFRTEVAAAAALTPERPLRRKLYEQEVRAAVDFRTLDQTHDDVLASVQSLYHGQVIPGQIQALGDAITTTKAGTPRQRVTRADMARISASGTHRDDLAGHLARAARTGAESAMAELAAQGAVAGAPSDSELLALVADQADAITALAADSISMMGARKAASVAAGRTPQQVAGEVRAHLGAAKHSWTMDQLAGAVTMAQNIGRVSVFATARQEQIVYYASEILDANCCSPCSGIDGTQYPDLSAAEQDYAAGGFVDCAGGPRCRGTLVAVYNEQDPTGGQAVDFG